ncbi:MAG: metal-sulfur cluster assembly factor [Chloroflexi bacterium]|nr:metal-sulfur cluster assembly factor [Chloroflexota bacterium]
MVTEEKVFDILRDVYDPEIPVNVVDLGLVYGVRIKGNKVYIKMTMTAPGCPMHEYIAEDAISKLEASEGIDEADVEIVWDPPWTPERMTAAGRKALGFS